MLKAELLVQFSIIYRGTHLINHFFSIVRWFW
uniref:Uncharacterized protein n=2 Tax=Oryza TaxID=4527 RepID=A0A0D3HL31_9ORYZ